MELKLYQTLDNENVINKSLTLIHTLNIKMKTRNSIVSPIIVLSNAGNKDYTNCNYCHIDTFNRFYFIRDIEILNDTNVQLSLECDVLESFKNDILNSSAEINRALKKGDYVNVNDATDLRKEIDIFESNQSFTEGKNIILSTIGGV